MVKKGLIRIGYSHTEPVGRNRKPKMISDQKELTDLTDFGIY
jgi:hypothetical protein